MNPVIIRIITFHLKSFKKCLSERQQFIDIELEMVDLIGYYTPESKKYQYCK